MNDSVPIGFKVRNSSELRDFLSLLKRLVDEERLVQFYPEYFVGESKESISELVELSASGFPDIICIYFEEKASGRKYMFTIDTYHGREGQWEELDVKEMNGRGLNAPRFDFRYLWDTVKHFVRFRCKLPWSKYRPNK